MNKIMLILSFFMSFFIGLEIIVLEKLPIGLGYNNAGYLDIGKLAYVIGGIFIIFSLFSFYLLSKELTKPKIPKCPKCKETFNYKDTNDGKCPNCKDVDTMDIKEYYEKFPDEKEE